MVQGPTKLPDQLASDEPHRVWLAFLVDRYRLVQTRSCEELAMIMQVCGCACGWVLGLPTRLPCAWVVSTADADAPSVPPQVLSASLEDVSKITCEPRCFGTRVRLLSFATAVLHAAQTSVEKRRAYMPRPAAIKPVFTVPLGGVGATWGPLYGLDMRLAKLGAVASVHEEALVVLRRQSQPQRDTEPTPCVPTAACP